VSDKARDKVRDGLELDRLFKRLRAEQADNFIMWSYCLVLAALGLLRWALNL
jgi:hypothetical protein